MATLASKAYESIKRDIISLKLAPGTLIAQQKLSERYGIGMTPIREALKRLQSENLVETRPNTGYFIAPITISNVQTLFETRKVIEGAVVQLAARRASPADIEEIIRLSTISYEYGNVESYVRYIEDNSRFHRLIAESSGNPKLADFNKVIIDEMARVLHLGLTYGDTHTRLSSDHINLAEAIAKRDYRQALESSNMEIDYAFMRVKQALTRLLTEPNFEWPLFQNLDLDGLGLHR